MEVFVGNFKPNEYEMILGGWFYMHAFGGEKGRYMAQSFTRTKPPHN